MSNEYQPIIIRNNKDFTVEINQNEISLAPLTSWKKLCRMMFRYDFENRDTIKYLNEFLPVWSKALKRDYEQAKMDMEVSYTYTTKKKAADLKKESEKADKIYKIFITEKEK